MPKDTTDHRLCRRAARNLQRHVDNVTAFLREQNMAEDAPTPPPFAEPVVHINPEGWCPLTTPDQFAKVPYAPFGLGDRLGKAADFVAADRWGNQRRWRFNRRDEPTDTNEDFQFTYDKEEEKSFELIDSTKDARRGGWGRGGMSLGSPRA